MLLLSIRSNQQIDEPSVLATVPMWFGLLDDEKAGAMITELASPEHQADWGMRIISSRSAKYGAGGYHFGSVWPLFTGWASVGEYRYHRSLPGFSNLKANAELALDGSLGHVTEVLVGRLLPAAFHQFSTPDLVGRHGGQPAAAWIVRPARLMPERTGSDDVPSRTRRLDLVHHRQYSRRHRLPSTGLSQKRRRDFSHRDSRRYWGLQLWTSRPQ